MTRLYKEKGYPADWIDKRLHGIAIRQNLIDECKQIGISERTDYVILITQISKATFGITPSANKKFKKLPDQSIANLMDLWFFL